MTQEQKITRGSVIIFVLSIILLLCLCVTATLAYFAGNQVTNTTLIMGGPVRVSMVDSTYQDISGQGNLVMNLKSTKDTLLPGMGIDMQAIAKLTSSDINSTPALLRAILDVEIHGISDSLAREVESQIRKSISDCLTFRIDSSQPGARPGWVQFDDGHYYYCSQNKVKDPKTNEEYIELEAHSTSQTGANVTFINGTFQFPYKAYTNQYSDIDITFNLRFQAIQDKIVNEAGERIPNTIFNVKQVLDNIDWNKHNN